MGSAVMLLKARLECHLKLELYTSLLTTTNAKSLKTLITLSSNTNLQLLITLFFQRPANLH